MRQCHSVSLGDVLSQVNRFESVSPEGTYPLLGVRLEGRGAFLRETVSGPETSATRLNRVAQGDFIYSRLFAWRGAFGIIGPDLDGSFVSNEFPIFAVDPDRICTSFLRYWFRLPAVWRRVEEDCTGSTPTTRNRYKERFFLSLKVPLLPLTEQQAIVSRLDALADKARQVNEHLDAIERDSLRLLVTMAKRSDISDAERYTLGWREAPISSIADLALDPQKVDAVESYTNIGIFSFARGLFEKPPIDGATTSAKTLYRIRQGQFIYSRLFAFEGAYALVPQEFDGYFVSNEFPTFEVNSELASAKFLMTLFLTEADWHGLRATSKGVGDRRLRIQPEHILARRISLPPRPEQSRVERLFDLHCALKARHTTIRQANDALIPATLERMFSGAD